MIRLRIFLMDLRRIKNKLSRITFHKKDKKIK